MNNLMSNFSNLALTRMEMKKVTGGCGVNVYGYANGKKTVKKVRHMTKAAAMKEAKTVNSWGSGVTAYYCCTHC